MSAESFYYMEESHDFRNRNYEFFFGSVNQQLLKQNCNINCLEAVDTNLRTAIDNLRYTIRKHIYIYGKDNTKHPHPIDFNFKQILYKSLEKTALTVEQKQEIFQNLKDYKFVKLIQKKIQQWNHTCEQLYKSHTLDIDRRVSRNNELRDIVKSMSEPCREIFYGAAIRLNLEDVQDILTLARLITGNSQFVRRLNGDPEKIRIIMRLLKSEKLLKNSAVTIRLFAMDRKDLKRASLIKLRDEINEIYNLSKNRLSQMDPEDPSAETINESFNTDVALIEYTATPLPAIKKWIKEGIFPDLKDLGNDIFTARISGDQTIEGATAQWLQDCLREKAKLTVVHADGTEDKYDFTKYYLKKDCEEELIGIMQKIAEQLVAESSPLVTLQAINGMTQHTMTVERVIALNAFKLPEHSINRNYKLEVLDDGALKLTRTVAPGAGYTLDSCITYNRNGYVEVHNAEMELKKIDPKAVKPVEVQQSEDNLIEDDNSEEEIDTRVHKAKIEEDNSEEEIDTRVHKAKITWEDVD